MMNSQKSERRVSYEVQRNATGSSVDNENEGYPFVILHKFNLPDLFGRSFFQPLFLTLSDIGGGRIPSPCAFSFIRFFMFAQCPEIQQV